MDHTICLQVGEPHLSEVLLVDPSLACLVKGEEGLPDLDLVLRHPVLQSGDDFISGHCVGAVLSSPVHTCSPKKPNKYLVFTF